MFWSYQQKKQESVPRSLAHVGEKFFSLYHQSQPSWFHSFCQYLSSNRSDSSSATVSRVAARWQRMRVAPCSQDGKRKEVPNLAGETPNFSSASYDPRIANAHTNTKDGGDKNGQHTLVTIKAWCHTCSWSKALFGVVVQKKLMLMYAVCHGQHCIIEIRSVCISCDYWQAIKIGVTSITPSWFQWCYNWFR